jgi:hypothetical protein
VADIRVAPEREEPRGRFGVSRGRFTGWSTLSRAAAYAVHMHDVVTSVLVGPLTRRSLDGLEPPPLGSTQVRAGSSGPALLRLPSNDSDLTARLGHRNSSGPQHLDGQTASDSSARFMTW